MSSIASKQRDLADKRALRESIRERMRWLDQQITAHGRSGYTERIPPLQRELMSLKQKSENLKREIRRMESPAFASKFYSASADR